MPHRCSPRTCSPGRARPAPGAQPTLVARLRPGAGSARRRPAAADRGSVTAETATALPSLVVVLLVAVWVLLCVAAQLRCVDAAHVAARAAARGDGDAAVRSAAARVAPDGAVVQVRRGGGEVEVVVRAQVQPFAGVLRVLPAVGVTGRAVAADEDAVLTSRSAAGP